MSKGKLTQRPAVHRPRARMTVLPVYDSITIASAATGIPEEAFKLAISEGCLCKHHNRIDVGEFIAWWFQDKEESDTERDVNWKRRGERANTLLSEIDLMKKQKTVLEKANGFRFLGRLMGFFFEELDRYKVEFPGTLAMRGPVDINVELDLQIRKTSESLKLMLDKFEKANSDVES